MYVSEGDQEGSSSSRPVRAPSRSGNADLLHTIARLREQRASSSSMQAKPSLPSPNCQTQGSISSQSSSSGRRRLCKVHSKEACKDSPIQGLNEDLEDWQDDEITENVASVDTLADNLDSLSIASEHSKEMTDLKEAIQMPKAKIMDSLSFLNEARKLSASGKVKPYMVVRDNIVASSKGSDKENTHDIKVKSYCDLTSLSQSSLAAKGQGPLVSKAVEAEVSWDLEDEKENLAGEPVMLVHNKIIFKLPPRIAGKLYPHQLEGIKWLWGLHIKGMGGILGDDMGLGKTMQMASFFVGLFASDLVKHVLIVATKSLIAHWRKELTSVGLEAKTRDYYGTCANQRQYALQYVLQQGGILLTTYDVVRNNWQALRGDFHGRDGFGDTSEDITTWDYMVLDERREGVTFRGHIFNEEWDLLVTFPYL
ncbi:hypothetical protein KP509_22G065600 [Ceratopteris richardii]|uniref:Helicase ATP-binding domain-containing protein n=1 Tax=Ceratopteris richardii TaxID=49495 RepID=A0A8T2S5Y4_CERRI|nr:hypothetical protein KP509_22G065600 [Ceratopteris richardii]